MELRTRVAIVGLGYTTPRAVTPEVSYKELTFEAAMRSYSEAGVSPDEIGSFVTCAEDFNEGTSIFDEYTPDQLGAVLRPMHTVCGDGLYGIIDAFMQIQAGLFDLVAVEAHSKASNILTPLNILTYATDPLFNRPLNLNPHYIASLEATRFFYESGNTPEQSALVVVKNLRNALKNPSGVYGEILTKDHVMASRAVMMPLKELEISRSSDGACVILLASEEKAKMLKSEPVWIKGVGWCSDSPNLDSRSWAEAPYAELSAKMAYRMAGIGDPRREIDLFEVDDTYSYKELQHLEAMGIFEKGQAGKALEAGLLMPEGEVPVNVSGGSLGMGHMLEATGLFRTIEIILQLRAQAGPRQLKRDIKCGLVQSWRGLPTTSGAVVILSKE